MKKNLIETLVVVAVISIIVVFTIRSIRQILDPYSFYNTSSEKELFIGVTVFVIVVFSYIFVTLINPNSYGHSDSPSKTEQKSVYSKSRDKRRAQNKPVPMQYLSAVPSGLTVGKYGRKYVSIPFLKSPEHQLILGGSGTGKTQTILNGLVWSYNFELQDKRIRAVLAVDSKPELSRKSVDENREDIRIVCPTRMDRWGFDVLYGLTARSSDDELDERSMTIAHSLIPDLTDDNAHFSTNAQKLLSGFIMYGFRKGWGFAKTIREVNSRAIPDFIAEVLEDPEMKEHPKLVAKLKPYEENTSDEFYSVVSNMTENLAIFNRDTVQYFFSGNPKKATPEDLVNGNSIFLSVPDYLLTQYKYIFGLCIELCLKHLMAIPEEPTRESMPYWVLIDEGGTIYVPSLIDVVCRARSKGVQLSLIAQDVPELSVLYGKEQAKTIINNCRTKIIFSCTDVESANSFKEWCGTYRERKVSRNRKGGSGSTTTSSEYRSIMDVSDIYSLEKTNRILIFVRGDWFVADKCPLYMIPELRFKSKEMVTLNDPYYG